jgi:SAM-dependent methyltransferase
MEDHMATATWETGVLLGEFPYIRLGNGPHNLLVIPGTQVDNVDPGFIVETTYRAAYANFARDHTLYLVNRKRDLPATYTSEDMAADYVRVLHHIGPARVMGLSAGCRQARPCSNSHFTGYDVSVEGIATAQAGAAERGLRTIHFAVQDDALLDAQTQYDLACTLDAMHGQADPARELDNIVRALRQGGVYLMEDMRAPAYHKKYGSFSGTALVHCVHHALHDRVAGVRWCRFGHDVGQRHGAPGAGRHRLWEW